VIDFHEQSLRLKEWLEDTAESSYEVARYEIRDPETDTLFTSGVCRSDSEELAMIKSTYSRGLVITFYTENDEDNL
jgi:hypothetical protein